MIKILNDEGYQNHKEALETYSDMPDDITVVRLTKQRLKEIKDALLDYRREHGIYESGDWIIYGGELMVFALYSQLAKDHCYIGYADAEDGEMVLIPDVRHATPEEIKTGYNGIYLGF